MNSVGFPESFPWQTQICGVAKGGCGHRGLKPAHPISQISHNCLFGAFFSWAGCITAVHTQTLSAHVKTVVIFLAWDTCTYSVSFFCYLVCRNKKKLLDTLNIIRSILTLPEMTHFYVHILVHKTHIMISVATEIKMASPLKIAWLRHCRSVKITFSSCSIQIVWATILQAAHFLRLTDFCLKMKERNRT